MLNYSHWAIRRYKKLRTIHRFNTIFAIVVFTFTVLGFGYSMVLYFIKWDMLPVVLLVLILSLISGFIGRSDRKLTNEDIERTIATFASGTASKDFIYQQIPGISESEYRGRSNGS